MRKYIEHFSFLSLMYIASKTALELIFESLKIDNRILYILCLCICLALCFYAKHNDLENISKFWFKVVGTIIIASFLLSYLFVAVYSFEALGSVINGSVILIIILRYSELMGIEERKNKN